MKFNIFVWLLVVISSVAYGQQDLGAPQDFPIFSPDGTQIQQEALIPLEGEILAEDQPAVLTPKVKSSKRTKSKTPKAQVTTVKPPKKEKEDRKSKRPTKTPDVQIPVTMKSRKHSKSTKAPVPTTTAAPVLVAKLKARKHLARRSHHHKKN